MNCLALFEREKVEFVVLNRRTDNELVGILRRRRGWIVDFEDKESVIFARNTREE